MVLGAPKRRLREHCAHITGLQCDEALPLGSATDGTLPSLYGARGEVFGLSLTRITHLDPLHRSIEVVHHRNQEGAAGRRAAVTHDRCGVSSKGYEEQHRQPQQTPPVRPFRGSYGPNCSAMGTLARVVSNTESALPAVRHRHSRPLRGS